MKRNYRSAAKSLAGVRRVVGIDVASGRMVKFFLEAIQAYSINLRIGSRGALTKGILDSKGDPVVHILHDGMWDAEGNIQVRVLDQDNTPAATVIKRVLKTKSESQLKFMGYRMVVDVRGAQSAWSGVSARSLPTAMQSFRQHRQLQEHRCSGAVVRCGVLPRPLLFFPLSTVHRDPPSSQRIMSTMPSSMTTRRLVGWLHDAQFGFVRGLALVRVRADLL